MPREVSPNDLDAEKHTLGAILIDPEAIHVALNILGEQTTKFFKSSHQLIYAAMVELTKDATPIDLYSVSNRLKQTGDLTRCGSISYLYEMQECVPTSANLDYYAEVVRDKWRRRLVLQAGNIMVSRAGEDDVATDELLELAQKELFLAAGGSTQQSTFEDLLVDSITRIHRLHSGDLVETSIPTGYVELDRSIYGLSPSDLVIIAARPGMGKSAFAHNIALNVAAAKGKKHGVALFTLEMGREQIMNRMISTTTGIPYPKIRQGKGLSGAELDRIAEAVDKLSGSRIHINDRSGIAPIEIAAECRRIALNGPLDVIIVDYMQLMSGGSNRQYNREQEISEYSRSLKSLARELNATVIALSQLNRAVENRPDKRPQLSDLRESGAIEQDADIVLMMYREDYYATDEEKTDEAEILIRKHRNGAVGDIPLNFDGPCMRFSSLEGNMYAGGNAAF